MSPAKNIVELLNKYYLTFSSKKKLAVDLREYFVFMSHIKIIK